MEINITSLKNTNLWDFAGSQHTHGTDAAQKTWDAALDGPQLLDTDEKRAAARTYFNDMGLTDALYMSSEETNAVFLQEITLQLREEGLDSIDEIGAGEGIESGRIFSDESGNVYFYLGS